MDRAVTSRARREPVASTSAGRSTTPPTRLAARPDTPHVPASPSAVLHPGPKTARAAPRRPQGHNWTREPTSRPLGEAKNVGSDGARTRDLRLHRRHRSSCKPGRAPQLRRRDDRACLPARLDRVHGPASPCTQHVPRPGWRDHGWPTVAPVRSTQVRSEASSAGMPCARTWVARRHRAAPDPHRPG